jgi:hypothetical protein
VPWCRYSEIALSPLLRHGERKRKGRPGKFARSEMIFGDTDSLETCATGMLPLPDRLYQRSAGRGQSRVQPKSQADLSYSETDLSSLWEGLPKIEFLTGKVRHRFANLTTPAAQAFSRDRSVAKVGRLGICVNQVQSDEPPLLHLLPARSERIALCGDLLKPLVEHRDQGFNF